MHDPQSLTTEIFQLMEDRDASPRAGTSAIASALVITMMHHKVSKEQTIGMIDKIWDRMEPLFEDYYAGSAP